MGMLKQDDGWRLPDEIWEVMATLLPERKPHPLGEESGKLPGLFAYRLRCHCVARNRPIGIGS